MSGLTKKQVTSPKLISNEKKNSPLVSQNNNTADYCCLCYQNTKDAKWICWGNLVPQSDN